MKRANKTFKVIPVVLLMVIVITNSKWAFAQGGSISGTVKDLSSNQGIEGVTITATDTRTSTLAGTTTTDASATHSLEIQCWGEYTLLASKPGYESMSVPDVMSFPNHSAPDRKHLHEPEGVLKFNSKAPKPFCPGRQGPAKS